MNIKEEIRRAIRSVYPSEAYGVYTEEPEPEIPRPCFVIAPQKGSAQPYPGGRLLLEESFDVRFYPDAAAPYEQCRQAAQALTDSLGLLTGVRASTLSWEVTDGVLHYAAAYSHFAGTMQGAEQMASLEQTQSVKPETKTAAHKTSNNTQGLV